MKVQGSKKVGRNVSLNEIFIEYEHGKAEILLRHCPNTHRYPRGWGVGGVMTSKIKFRRQNFAPNHSHNNRKIVRQAMSARAVQEKKTEREGVVPAPPWAGPHRPRGSGAPTAVPSAASGANSREAIRHPASYPAHPPLPQQRCNNLGVKFKKPSTCGTMTTSSQPQSTHTIGAGYGMSNLRQKHGGCVELLSGLHGD